jgi:AdoMet-dependent heme synthase
MRTDEAFIRSPQVSSRLEKKASKVTVLAYIFKRHDFYFYELNEIAALIWSLSDGQHSVSGISKVISEKYALPAKKAKSDVSRFIESLKREDLLVEEEKINNCSRLFSGNKINLLETVKDSYRKPGFRVFSSGTMNPGNFDRPCAPVFVYFEITKRCNLQCKHCYLSTDSKDISTDGVKYILDELVAHNVLMLCIIGGEPFIRPDFFEILEYARKKGLRVIIVTNGTLLDKNKLLRLRDIGIDRLAFSLEGSSPQKHNFIRGENIFQAVIENIRLAVSFGVPVEISFTLDKESFSEFNSMRRLAKELKVPRIAISEFKKVGVGLKNSASLAFTPAQACKIYIRGRFFNGKRGDLKVCIPRNCDAGFTICKIDPSGFLTPCLFLDVPFGNMLTERLDSVWNGPKFRDFLNYNNFKTPCRWCPLKNRCQGFCRAETYYSKGGYFEANPNCVITKCYQRIKNLGN